MQSNLTRKELRDYFAAEAMNGLVVGSSDRLRHRGCHAGGVRAARGSAQGDVTCDPPGA